MAWNERSNEFTDYRKILKEAKICQSWLYNLETKAWYTPEEFENYFTGLSQDYRVKAEILKQFRIVHPSNGLRLRVEYLGKITVKISKEIADFNQRIKDYYWKDK